MVKDSLLSYYGLQVYIFLLIFIGEEDLRLMLTSVTNLKVR